MVINMITIRYTFLIPRIEDLMDCLGVVMYFTKMYLKRGYHQLRIKEGQSGKPLLKEKMACNVVSTSIEVIVYIISLVLLEILISDKNISLPL